MRLLLCCTGLTLSGTTGSCLHNRFAGFLARRPYFKPAAKLSCSTFIFNANVLSHADQYEIENNLLPQYRVEGRFERINEHRALTQFGTATITTRNIGTLEASYKDNGCSDTGTRKDGMNGFFDAIRGIWKTIWGYFVDFFTGSIWFEEAEAGSMKKIGKKFSPIKHHHHHRHHHHNHRHHGHRNHQDSVERLDDAWEGYSTNKKNTVI
ncbi:hypothetical protein H6P81_003653 [Aristolochia fimbriata]|uniref:Uncharacterized protein n=1 Tax=Aristolochia fimbriata TaxID=158543 RepID=A0AAV7FG63_ARIFI|nr:hypothetical protein H6P81_003653 [Aristolochia fimbriata]